EVVDDQGRAGPGAGRDVSDPGVREAAFLDDLDGGAQHLLATLVGGVGHIASTFTHADILAHFARHVAHFPQQPTLDPGGWIWRALLWQRYQVSRLNIQSMR